MTSSRRRRYRSQQGSVLLRVVLFSLSLTLLFTLVANLLPQIEGEAPIETEIDLDNLSMDDFVALGESIFSGKGTCTLCHNNLGRAPDILQLDMVATAKQRLADERYQGGAGGVVDYLRESMLNPGVFVVKGYGQKGSNDTESPMPVVNKAPILLNDNEIDAIIAFMQAKDGNEVTISLPENLPEATAQQTTEASQTVAVAAPADTAEAVFGKYACNACHSIAGSVSPVGPDLNQVSERLDRTQISQSIIDPNAVIADGFFAGVMPADFATRMTVSELNLVLDYLVDQKAGL